MASLKLALLTLVALHTASSCTYFCKDERTNSYICCDAGPPAAPAAPGGDGANAPGNSTNPGVPGNPGNSGTPGNPGIPGGGDETDPSSNGGVHTVVVTEYGPEDGARYNTSSGCVYYCAYGGSVYCCDDGSLTMPGDHDPHGGRCPTEHEQVCKDEAVFLSLKAKKVGRTLAGTTELSQIGDESVRCASDGYCAQDEKCCTSVCHKRHVCLRALHSEKEKP